MVNIDKVTDFSWAIRLALRRRAGITVDDGAEIFITADAEIIVDARDPFRFGIAG